MAMLRIQKWARQAYDDVSMKITVIGMTEKMIYGEYIMKNRIYDRTIEAAIPKIRQRIYEAENNLERVKLFHEFYSEEKFRKFLETMDEAFEKDESTAEKFMEKSLIFYGKNDYEMAYRCCALAFLLTPADCGSMPGRYCHRAIVLRRLNEFNLAISDIESALALEMDFNAEMRKKLNGLKKKCVRALKAPELLRKAESELEFKEETDKRQIYSDEVLFSIFGEPHSEIQCTGNYLDIVTDPVKGRILVVNQDLRAGTTIIVEDPYVSVLTESLKWELKHCSRCYMKTRNLIACPDCVYAAYCGEECRLADYECLHQYECQCLNYLHAINIPTSMQMGFRAVCKAGPSAMYQLYKKSNAGPNLTDEKIPGFNPETGCYDSDSYYQVYHLASHLSSQHLEFHTWHSFSLAKLLDIETTFFELIDPTEKSGFMDFIASCFLQHSIAIPYNAISAWEDERPSRPKSSGFFGIQSSAFFGMKLSDPEPTPEMSRIERLYKYGAIGMTGVYPLSSLLSHSCDPSAAGITLKNGKLAIFTCRALKAGDEVTLSYGYEFTVHDLNERRLGLMERYRFMCGCVACNSKWPTGDRVGCEIEFLCPTCPRALTYEERVKSRKYVLTGGRKDLGTCGNCKKNYYTPILTKDVTKYHTMIGEARQLLIRDNPIDSIPLLVQAIEFFQYKIMSPSLPMIQAQSLLMWAHESISTNSRV